MLSPSASEGSQVSHVKVPPLARMLAHPGSSESVTRRTRSASRPPWCRASSRDCAVIGPICIPRAATYAADSRPDARPARRRRRAPRALACCDACALCAPFGLEPVDVDAVGPGQPAVHRRGQRRRPLLLEGHLGRRSAEGLGQLGHPVERIDRHDVDGRARGRGHVVAVAHRRRPVDDAVLVVAVAAPRQIGHEPGRRIDRAAEVVRRCSTTPGTPRSAAARRRTPARSCHTHSG